MMGGVETDVMFEAQEQIIRSTEEFHEEATSCINLGS